MLIGLTGKRGSGKDTAANYIEYILRNRGYDYQRLAYADSIKNMLGILLDIPREYFDDPKLKEKPLKEYNNITPRDLMLTAHELKCLFGDDLYIRPVQEIYEEKDKNIYIITDVRLPNEAEWVRNNGGILIHISGHHSYGGDVLHVTENGVSQEPEDMIIMNDGTEQDLEKKVESVMDVILNDI